MAPSEGADAVREHEPSQPGEAPATGGREVHTDAFVKHIAIAERAMVKSLNSGQRIEEIMSGAQVNKRRARRLIRAVNKLWHYRAQAFGTPQRSRVKILTKPPVDSPKHDKFFGRRKAGVIDGGRA